MRGLDLDQPLAPSAWHGSLWREAPDHQSNPSLQDNIQVDVAVVGAGFTGLRAATRLAEAGCSVTVLDAQDVGWGASGRSGGQVNPMLPVNSPDQIRALVGERAFSNLSKASLKSADELFELIETYQIRCDARQNGWLRVLHSEKALRQAEKDHKNWNAIGGEMQLIEGAEVERLSGSPKYKAGVVTKRGGAVHPFKLVCGLARVAKAAGVQIFAQSPVQKTERSGNHWVATTPEGQVTAEWIVVATNGYTDALVPGLARSIIPVTPIQIATDPLPDDVYHSILPQGHTISDSRRIIMYARREPDNRVVYGGLGRVKNGEFTGFDWLKADAVKVFPQLKDATWSHNWGGSIALTDDHLPHVHQPQDKMLVGLGYNGRGVAMSFVVGRTLAEKVLGEKDQDLDLPISAIKPFALRSTKMFGMRTAVSFMRLLDRWEFR